MILIKKTGHFFSLSILCVVVFSGKLKAQSQDIDNLSSSELNKQLSVKQERAIKLNLAGEGGFVSSQFQQQFYKCSRAKFLYSVGFGFAGFRDQNNMFNPNILIPIGMLYKKGEARSLVVGVNNILSTVVKADSKSFEPKRFYELHFSVSVGYRHQFNDKIFLDISYTPIIQNYRYYIHWGAFGLGYKIK